MAELTLNTVQADIMRRLFEQDGLRFSEVNTAKLPTDQFSYHLRQLQKGGLIEKLPNQTYSLTVQGKLKAILLKPNDRRLIDQGFTAVIVVISKEENGENFYLLQDRDKVPYKGLAAIPGDKVYFGESTQNAAERALHLQTGLLSDSLTLSSIWHIRDIYTEEVVQDKYFYVYATNHFEGILKPTGITGDNRWVAHSQLKAKDMLHNTADIIESTLSHPLTYHEVTYLVAAY